MRPPVIFETTGGLAKAGSLHATLKSPTAQVKIFPQIFCFGHPIYSEGSGGHGGARACTMKAGVPKLGCQASLTVIIARRRRGVRAISTKGDGYETKKFMASDFL